MSTASRRPVPFAGALFETCDRKRRAIINRLGTDVAVRPQTILCKEEATPPQFIAVCSGSVALHRNGHLVATVVPGGWFGHESLLARRAVEVFTAIATEPTRLWVCSRGEFASILSAAPVIRETLLAVRAVTVVRNMVEIDLCQSATEWSDAPRGLPVLRNSR
jgi:CRP-like cAMP-binding protein